MSRRLKREYKYFACDFETTVYEGQDYTEVWLSGAIELYTDKPYVFGSIDGLFDFFKKQRTNIIAYFHNLKFDGSFILDYLLIQEKMKQASIQSGSQENNISWIPPDDMQNGTFQYAISDKGQWYTIILKYRDRYIEFRDSLKLLPFSLTAIGKSFNTPHKKLSMEYEGFRYANCPVTPQELEYFHNDLYVLKEALEIMFDQGHQRLTIGACCLNEFKTIITPDYYKQLFPNLYHVEIDPIRHEYNNAGDYIRKAYRGGWSYLVKGKENKIFNNGITADVNSLYPSVMSSESGCRYPVGLPKFWTVNFIPDEAKINDRYYFIRIKTRFKIKPNMLPFIQIKGTLFYKPTECLTSSDIYDRHTGKYYKTYIDFDGIEKTPRPELTLTCVDYKLFLEHYDVTDFEIIDGCYFDTEIGLFDDYIQRYQEIKMNSKGALRTLAKLFLNNLYGKFAASTDSSFKYAYEKEDKSIGFFEVEQHDKIAGYIAIGAAVTSYAKNFTIRAAQENYYGVDNAGFIYADTDSIHCDLSAEQLKGIKIHPNNFCCWKLEASWDKAIFVRQKTYIEHVTHEDLEPIEKPYYNIKCAGMPDKCKNLLNASMTGIIPYATVDDFGQYKPIKYNNKEKQFLSIMRSMTDFKAGLIVPSKLMPKRIRGGIVLVNTDYEMRIT